MNINYKHLFTIGLHITLNRLKYLKGDNMLELVNIKKAYKAGSGTVTALKNINLKFEKNEFVSILGPSGCGKTTLLNIIGGLDSYTEGDLIINGTSTKEYKDKDWDAYRNRSIGFVFQSYNLIPHLTVLGNVELALTLCGLSPKERREASLKALDRVGLSEQINKRPNQLSGGQMQRVAIARALVNNPDIILADEPTGALDSETSNQVMELLKEVSNERLVIMVTHNDSLADKYSSRIIRLLDGEIISSENRIDTNKNSLSSEKKKAKSKQTNQTAENSVKSQNDNSADIADGKIDDGAVKKKNFKRLFKRKNNESRTSMSFFTAIALSLKNLLTKKGRIFMTGFAGSIGIIGIALVLSLSNGLSQYINNIQTESLSQSPIQITKSAYKLDEIMAMQNGLEVELEAYPDNSDRIYPYEPMSDQFIKENIITQEYIDYINKIDSSLLLAINYSYGVSMNISTKHNGTVSVMNTADTGFQEMLNNDEFIESHYDLIAGEKFPSSYNEISLVVDKYNRLSTQALNALNIGFEDGQESVSFESLLGKEFRLLLNDVYYQNDNGIFTVTDDLNSAYEKGVPLKIVSIIRVKESSDTSFLNQGLVYTSALTEYVLEENGKSQIVQEQLKEENKTIDVTTGKTFTLKVGEFEKPITDEEELEEALQTQLRKLGAISVPSSVSIYPSDFDSKNEIIAYLDKWNEGKSEEEQIIYTDMSGIIFTVMDEMVDTVSVVLVAFSAISLVVSSIMIGIITYVSVIERTKEIGVLRSLGARKKDVSRVFKAETLIIGLFAGVLGIIITALINIPINIAVSNSFGISNLANLHWATALILIAISMVLTLVAGLIPSKIAAKKNPVTALRTE